MTQLISQDNNNIPLKFAVFIPHVSATISEFITRQVYLSPEVQSLRSLTENNPWHDHENVLTHAETVFANLQSLLTLYFIHDPDLKHKYQKYLDSKPNAQGQYSLQDLLLLACSLHDIGKGLIRPPTDPLAPGKLYLFTKTDGHTQGTGHEQASANYAPALLKPLKLTPKDRSTVIDLIAKHDTFSLNYCQQHLSPDNDHDPKHDTEIIKATQPKYAFVLLLHIIADEYGATITQSLRNYQLTEIISKHSLI